MIRKCLFALLALFALACGKDENSDNNANNTSTNGCQTTGDCPSDDTFTFLDESKLSCEQDVTGRGYCSECLNDRDCGEGNNCVDRTYCEELDACTTSRDCADEGELVHFACIGGGCQFCDDEIQCDMNADEMCYNRLCVPRANVDQECIDANCGMDGETPCTTATNEDGQPTGFECVP